MYGSRTPVGIRSCDGTPTGWRRRPVVVDERYGVGEEVTGLVLRPVDHLENIGTRDVVGVSRAVRRPLAAAVKVDPEARAAVLPIAVAFVDLRDLDISHVESLAPAALVAMAH